MSQSMNNVNVKGLEIDIDAFEMEIDREIDALFIPTSELQLKPGASPVVKEDLPKPNSKQESPSSCDPMQLSENSNLLERHTGAESESDTVLEYTELITLEEPVIVDSQDVRTNELNTFLESFSVAYLSLDWDFSTENIIEMGQALDHLEPYCKKTQEAQSLYKILKAVLQRYKMDPESASPEVVDLIRSSQDLLRHILVLEDGPSPTQRESVKRLIGQALSLRESGAFGKARNSQSVDIRPNAELVRKELPSSAGQPGQSACGSREPNPGEFTNWLERHRTLAAETFYKIDEERNRLRQIEDVVRKKPALAPLASRLGSIRESLDEHLSVLRQEENEWESVTKGLFDSGAYQAKESVAAAPDLPADTNIQGGTTDGDSARLEGDLRMPEGTAQETVCVFSVSGKRTAILSHQVVKIEQVSDKKLRRIRNRGYVTLEEFKPLFRSIRTGLFAPWSNLPAKILREYRFIPVSNEDLQASIPDKRGGSLILVSNGTLHRAIFADPGVFDLLKETVTREAGINGVWGLIRKSSQEDVEVIDLDAILSKETG